jgi:TRAP-type C4-dicarboxylate transport system substrate-binding protein
MKTTRRTFLTGTLAASTAATMPWKPAMAAEELKLATFVPPTHIQMAKVIIPWAQEMPKLTNGELTVRVFPSMQLGGKPPGLYRQMMQGISDITFTLPGYTSADFPMCALTELPNMSDSGADGTRKLWANLDKTVARDFKGAKVLMLWNSDTASIMTKSKPVRTIDDMKGLKLRSPSRAQSAQLAALGAIPVDMPATQIYNAIDRGVVDGTMIPMSAAVDFKLIEVVKYFTVNAPLGRSPFLVAMNEERYNKLPANLRKVIDDTTGLQLSLRAADVYDQQNKVAMAAAEKDREVFPLSAAERARWVKAFQPVILKAVADGDKAGLPATALVKAYGNLPS